MVVAIPKAGNLKHLIENAQTCDFRLSEEDIWEIEKQFLYSYYL